MKKYFIKEYKRIALMIILIFATTSASIFMSNIKGRIVDSIIYQGSFDLGRYILIFAVAITLMISTGYVLAILRYYIIKSTVKRLQDDIMKIVFMSDRSKLFSLDRAEVLTAYTTKLGIIDNNYLVVCGRVMEYFFIILLTMVALLRIDVDVTVLSFALFVVPVFVTRSQQSKLSDSQSAYLNDKGTHNHKFMSYIKSIEIIKNYHIESKIIGLYENTLNEITDSDMTRGVVKANTNGLSSVLTYISQGIITFYCAYCVFTGRLTAGQFVTVFSLISALSTPIYWLARSVEMILSAKPAVDSVVEFIGENREIITVATPVMKNGHILDIRNMSFAYEDKPVLDGINFTLDYGEKVLILGKSGSGKSTMINLIMGYIKPQGGEILKPEGDLSKLVTLASQDAFVFEDTISGNLFSVDSVLNREMIKKVGLSSLVGEKWDSFMVGEKGKNISGGQKKRIALARSFITKTPILILDEPLANIDSQNIDLIEDYICGINDRAVIVISHQISQRLLDCMDRIYVIENGYLHEIEKECVCVNQEAYDEEI